MKDLVVLAADKDLQFALEGLLTRPEALGIRPIEKDIFVEPEHDPGCALRGVEFLRPFASQYRHGLLIFDHEGSGREGQARKQLQNNLNRAFARFWGEEQGLCHRDRTGVGGVGVEHVAACLRRFGLGKPATRASSLVGPTTMVGERRDQARSAQGSVSGGTAPSATTAERVLVSTACRACFSARL